MAARQESVTSTTDTGHRGTGAQRKIGFGRRVSASLCFVAACVAAIAAQRPAQRIVSLVPAVTEMLFAIGAGPQVVAVSSYDDFPAQVKSLPRVGALLDPDVERILALRPQLVVSYGSQSDLHGQLKRASIPVYSYRHAGIGGIFTTMREVGTATGHAAEAERLARSIEAQLGSIRARVKDRRRPRTLLVFERDPQSLRGLYVSGGRGFLHEMLEIAGGVNVFADVEREAVQPSHETLIARAPEVILEIRATGLLSPAGAKGKDRDAWNVLASVPAVRNGRMYFMNGDHMLVPGPRVAQGTEAFARALHPDVFK
jgi:iron complex transport system substrate-binding protein